VSSPAPNLYVELRSNLLAATAFRDKADMPSERLLQGIWERQRILRDNLRTLDGRRLFILHPGFLNREAGPDFKRAVIRIEDGPVQEGDVEVDLTPAQWRQHHHADNPAYGNVILHVVWQAAGVGGGVPSLPTLALETLLDAPLSRLARWLDHSHPRAGGVKVNGRCSGPLGKLQPAAMEALLEQAALCRLQARAEHIAARARADGWTQALWEALFRALGYKHNVWPMVRLAELRPRWHQPGSTRVELEARLLGIAGLLPANPVITTDAGTRHVKALWDAWWRDREEFAEYILPPGTWRMAGVRPANHPQRRLALAAWWLTQPDLASRLRTWARETAKPAMLRESLERLLRPPATGFWSTHLTLRSAATTTPLQLLGTERLADLAANAILPWLWAVAEAGKRDSVCREVETRYLSWPKAAENAVLKLARARLLGATKHTLPPRLALQQGLHQIVRDYCDPSNSLCDGCRFPDLVREFGGQSAG
jgi:hypothetical protein